MHRLQEFLAVALAEMRAARRLARTWIFIALAALLGILTYLQYAAIHGFGSGFSASLGAFGPRMLIASIGMIMVIFLIVGIVFLAFDIRARDQRERMAEVLDSRPIGTVALLGGRLAGLVFILWLAVALVMGLIQLIGVTARAFDWWIGDTVEPVSLASFLVLDALPALALWGSVVILLAVTVRNRLIVAVLSLGAFGLYAWSGFVIPFYLARVLSGFQASVGTSSDLVPVFAGEELLPQRLCTVVLAVGLVFFAAALHPRQDGRGRGPRLAVGGAMTALACAGIALLVVDATNARTHRAGWTAAHVAMQDQPRADLERIRGSVAIDPGRRLALQLVYDLKAARPTDELVFSFNPGLQVTEALVGGTPAETSHESGLLRVALPASLQEGESVQLELTAAGFPDTKFGYLDSNLDLDLVSGESANVMLLGTDVSVFDRRYVALLPGGRWLPMPGAATGNGDPARYGQDYFQVDLEVDVPDGWLVAGPGRRRTTERGGFRFAPPAAVPDVALLASRFDRRHLEVGGVVFELLLHPGHGAYLGSFADAVDVIEERIGEMLADAAAIGLAYPYEGFSLVEVPARLRVFGGGWRMDSVQAQPGILMLREYGLPTARFDTLFRVLRQFGDGIPEGEDAGPEAGYLKIGMLQSFFAGDFSGGKLADGVTRNFLRFQAGAQGEGAIALDYVCHELAASLVYRSYVGDYFSPRTFASAADLNETLAQMAGGLVTGGGLNITMNTGSGAPARAATWSLALGAPLAALDPEQGAHEALDLLALKAPAVAKSIMDGVGRDAAGALLSELRRRFAGTNFTIEDFNTVARDTGVDLDSLLGDWLGDSSLPGFLVSEVDVVRLVDGERGEPRYQVRVQVRNDEPAPGLVRFRVAPDDRERVTLSDPVRVASHASVELGLVVDAPPAEAWLSPYLSLNRRDMRLAVAEFDAEGALDAEPFNGSRASDWRPQPEPGIVVDDLDPRFGVVYANTADEDRYGQRAPAWLGGGVEFDQGLPVYNPFVLPPRGWARTELAGTWGRYRHTLANAFPGDGAAWARFPADLPQAGRWRVDYHMPVIGSPSDSPAGSGFTVRIQAGVLSQEKGDYEVKIVADGVETPVEFDAAAATDGWNNLGEFSLPAGEVGLLVSNKTSGSMVIADAVRWRLVGAP